MGHGACDERAWGMSIAIALHLQGKRVLIIGGGAVALRKARQFADEQALVTVLAPSFISAFDALAVRRISAGYARACLRGYLLVYAASDDAELNAQIVQDAGEEGILCGSATQCAHATFTSMRQADAQTYTLALSTHAHAIALGGQMLADAQASIDARHGSRLALLAFLHEAMGERYGPIRALLSRMEEEKLALFADMLRKGKVQVFVFHGTDSPRALAHLRQTFQGSGTDHMRCFCFASRRVIARCPQVLSLDELTAFVKAASGLLTVHVQLAFVQRRQLYAQAKDALSALGEIAPFWLDEEALEEMVRYAEQKASKARCLFITHHPFAQLSAMAKAHGALCLSLRDPLPAVQGEIMLFPVFMTYGEHVRNDLFAGECSIVAALRGRGCTVLAHDQALSEQEWAIRRLLALPACT